MISYPDFAFLLNQSHEHWTGDYLVAATKPEKILEAINTAEFPLLAQGQEANPLFNYGNLAALKLLETSFESLIQLPARDTLEQGKTRYGMQNQLEVQGVRQAYQGIWVTGKGKRVGIERATIWKVVDRLTRVHGQALKITSWRYLTDT